MRLFIEVIEGPDQGQQINLKDSASVGRKGSDILLNDPKLSGIHAFFRYDGSQGWFIKDNDSRNGIWVNGIREHELQISDGLELQMGQSILLCKLIVKASKKAEGGFLMWLQKLLKQVPNRPGSMEEIKPEMRLKIIEGMQYGEIWDIFYGPRVAGKEQIDICLYDEKAPTEAFEILVKKRYPYFRTKHPEQVKINGEALKDKQLVPGDIIQVGDSKILIEFDHGNGFHS